MKRLESSTAISIAILTIIAISTTSLTAPSFAATPSKKFHLAGRAGTTAANTVRNGKGAPANSLGLDGDFYIDTAKLNFYGPKENGLWPNPASLKGPAGSNGVDGKPGSVGADGKTGSSGEKGSAITASGTHGPRGPQGLQGLPGIAGSTGLTGPDGQTGSVGTAGPPGTPGTAGPSGTPGSAGANGSTGATGPSGLAGLAGSAGATGPTGPSQVSIGTISFAQQLRGSSGTSVVSNAFGSFAAGKDYFVHIMIYGVRQVTAFASLRITIYAVGGSPIVQTSYLITDGASYRTVAGENDTNLDVLVTVDGSTVPNAYQLGATISALDVTSTDYVTFTGTYLNELVGSIS